MPGSNIPPSPAEMRHARDEPTPGGGRAGAPGAHGVILMDRAGWHGATELVGPDPLALGLRPARAPELTPLETIWPLRRDPCLPRRVSAPYPHIVNPSCQPWNRLIDQPWIIMSIG